MLVPATVRLHLGEVELEGETAVPSGQVTLEEMLPAFRAVAQALVHLGVAASGKQVSCAKGCAACCRMAIPVSEPEAHRLRAVVDAMPEPRRSAVRARFSAGMDLFHATGLLDGMFQRDEGDEAERRARTNLESYYAKFVACPFLEDESCSIYDERPLVCRGFLVTSPAANCANIDGAGVQRLPIFARSGDALILIASKPGSSRTASMPLIQLLEWTDRNSDDGDRRTGPEWLGMFTEMLQTEASNVGN